MIILHTTWLARLCFMVMAFFLAVSINSIASASNLTYIMAARQNDLMSSQSRIADKAANTNTTAYKAENDIYGELTTRLDNRKNLSFSNISTTIRDTSQGSMQVTGRQLDIAINGPGYFMVSTPLGLRFTRAGNLKTTSEGVLVTQGGNPLLGSGGGQVEFAEGDTDISIREDGSVTAGVEERGQIAVFVFADEQALIREGEGLYRTDQTPVVAEKSKIAQGMLEDSNANSVRTMTDLIEVSRNIETVKSVQSDYHQMQMDILRRLARE